MKKMTYEEARSWAKNNLLPFGIDSQRKVSAWKKGAFPNAPAAPPGFFWPPGNIKFKGWPDFFGIAREGPGRKPKSPEGARIQFSVTLLPSHHKALQGLDTSEALDMGLEYSIKILTARKGIKEISKILLIL